MATAVIAVQQRKIDETLSKDQAEFIPDIIEERRKDSDGRQVLTKYARGKLLGKGGFAKCFLGTHMPSLKQYALKIVYKSTLAKSSAKQKLQTEIKIHRTLKHSYVVKFERFFEDNTNVYMVLELCSNNSMSNMLKKRKRLADVEVRYYLQQLVKALQYLHSNLVIHRDLKLGNLFIDSQMRLKVGDFGLATRLTDPLERKKTFCGTPNYIAPEVLEGKNGHSFEVDVWSTGVIMYTLLVGRPPFESKNVEATYKRIQANSYTFPDQPATCDHAKSLLRDIFQTKPETRPSLDEILQHSFFTRSGVSTPSQLPESALRDVPMFAASDVVDSVIGKKINKITTEAVYNNENDPLGANRIHANNQVKQKIMSPNQKDLGSKFRFSNQVAIIQSAPEVPISSSRDAIRKVSLAATTNSLQAASTVPKHTSPMVQDPAALAPPQKRERLSSNLSAQEKRLQPSKFEIYEDIKLSPPPRKMSAGYMPVTAHSQQQALNQRDVAFKSSNSMSSNTALGVGKDGVEIPQLQSPRLRCGTAHTGRLAPVRTFSSSSAPKEPGSLSEVDRLRTTLEYINIKDQQHPTPSGLGISPSDVLEEVDLRPYSRTRSQSAWTGTGTGTALQASAPLHLSQKLSGTVDHRSPDHVLTRAADMGRYSNNKLTPEQRSQPMQMATPLDQAINVNEYKALCTLECMHGVLSSRNLDDLDPDNRQEASGISRMIYTKHPSAIHAANIWVVRYVDYTSKYGLGFLLNTGSAGVYFNDSTKIIVSPDGCSFQYNERKRKEKGTTSSEHTIQSHSVSRYPLELQKKVTLLRHFRNYLVDQQKGAFPCDDGSAAGGSEAMEKMATLEGASSGACALIPFGHSSISFSAAEASAMGCVPSLSSTAPEMPFLKKWVRTKHAILFRLSNRTVQVLFMDRSEVLLTSEARMVTYVSKQNVRTEHSLEEVLQTGRSDIAKRLKYAKDIMYRLISTNVK